MNYRTWVDFIVSPMWPIRRPRNSKKQFGAFADTPGKRFEGTRWAIIENYAVRHLGFWKVPQIFFTEAIPIQVCESRLLIHLFRTSIQPSRVPEQTMQSEKYGKMSKKNPRSIAVADLTQAIQSPSQKPTTRGGGNKLQSSKLLKQGYMELKCPRGWTSLPKSYTTNICASKPLQRRF